MSSINATSPPPPEFTAFTGKDFRSAIIDNHWNDPPTKIFKSTEVIDAEVDSEIIHKVINETLLRCQENFKTGIQKRMVDDTTRRMNQLLKTIEDHGIEKHVLHSLCQLCQALERREYEGATELHVKMMTKAYDNQSQWLVGMKRLIDLDQKISQ
ncbi:protein transport protein S31 [Umbelopsis sp. WA50703]